MSIIRVEKKGNYSVISNECLDDPELSFKAKGLLCYLLTKPSHWTINVKHLITVSKDGRDAVYSIIDDLVVAGYIVKERIKGEAGKFAAFNYIVHEHKPLPGFPDTVSPETEKPEHSNTYILVNTESSLPKPKNEIRERKIAFLKEILDWYEQHPGKYPKLMLVECAKYWTEKTLNKKKELMRFEDQKFFEIGKRLATWFGKSKDIEITIQWEKENKIDTLPKLFNSLFK